MGEWMDEMDAAMEYACPREEHFICLFTLLYKYGIYQVYIYRNEQKIKK